MRYYLHYVGNKLYPEKVFIEEAKKVGVNRCLPTRMLKKLEWGDRILLATFISGEQEYTCDDCKKCGETVCGNDTEHFSCFEGKLDGRKNKRNGTAKVFGYFDIRGLNINASPELKKRLMNQLTIVSSLEINRKVQRQCGSYSIGTSYVIEDTVAEIVEKAELLEKLIKEKVKFFIAGNFYPLSLTIEPINFTRTIILVEIDNKLPVDELINGEVGLIYDYNKRAYIKKYAKRGRPKKEK